MTSFRWASGKDSQMRMSSSVVLLMEVFYNGFSRLSTLQPGFLACASIQTSPDNRYGTDTARWNRSGSVLTMRDD
jgi:hypothetical protein